MIWEFSEESYSPIFYLFFLTYPIHIYAHLLFFLHVSIGKHNSNSNYSRTIKSETRGKDMPLQ